MSGRVYIVALPQERQIVEVDTLPRAGETSIGAIGESDFAGATAELVRTLRELGATPRLLGQVGDDAAGARIRERLVGDEATIFTHDALPTTQTILLSRGDEQGALVHLPGAAEALEVERVDELLEPAEAGDTLLVQLASRSASDENAPPAALHALQLARHKGLRLVLQVVAMRSLPELDGVELLFVDKAALRFASGGHGEHLESARAIAARLQRRGSAHVVVGVEARGLLLVDSEGSHFLPAFDDLPGPGVREAIMLAGIVARLAIDNAPLRQGGDLALAAAAARVTTPDEPLDVEALARRVIEQPAASRDRRRDERSAPAGLGERARSIRKRVIRMLGAAQSGHPGGSLSVVDILTILYFSELRYRPSEPHWPDRDRVVLSKGHAAPALYSTLIELGALDASMEGELRRLGSPLQGHPDRLRCPGVEMSTGSLGQGLSVSSGLALAAKRLGADWRVFCLLSDGELHEGQTWEAAMTAAHRKLDNLCAIIDYNGLHSLQPALESKANLEPVAGKWRAFGWHAVVVDGHSFDALHGALKRARSMRGGPCVIVAHTVKGRGVSFMEAAGEYHGSRVTPDEMRRALEELDRR